MLSSTSTWIQNGSSAPLPTRKGRRLPYPGPPDSLGMGRMRSAYPELAVGTTIDSWLRWQTGSSTLQGSFILFTVPAHPSALWPVSPPSRTICQGPHCLARRFVVK